LEIKTAFSKPHTMINFFTKEEGDRIVSAIRAAESNTSGEIRVHLEQLCKEKTFREAVTVFERLGMHRTKDRNGVLFFLVPERKEFSILGDKGINDVVPEGFWADVTELVQSHFRTGRYADGVCEGILRIGEKLKNYFPYKRDDVNELPDTISYGKK
jgi:uncharacterized membrane protein